SRSPSGAPRRPLRPRRQATSAASRRPFRASRRVGDDEAAASLAARPGRFPPRMTTLIFVLVWVVLGLGLVLVALSGGPGGALQRMMSTSRAARRVAIVLFTLALLLLGIGVPAAVIAAVSSNNSIPEANVTDLTASEQHGR